MILQEEPWNQRMAYKFYFQEIMINLTRYAAATRPKAAIPYNYGTKTTQSAQIHNAPSTLDEEVQNLCYT